MELTRKEVKRLTNGYNVYGPRYCSEYDYCKKYNINKFDLVKIGYNAGVYGWNFSLYFDPKNNNYIISSYRNAPNLEYTKL